MKKLNEKQQEELDFIKEWSLFIINHLIRVFGDNSAISLMKQIITEESEKQNLNGMRYAFKDMNEWGRSISLAFENELNVLLKEKFGKDLNYFSGKGLRKIKQIVKRGKILNPDECRLVATRVDEIYADDTKKEELEKLNDLLSDYKLHGEPEI